MGYRRNRGHRYGGAEEKNAPDQPCLHLSTPKGRNTFYPKDNTTIIVFFNAPMQYENRARHGLKRG